MTTVPWSSVVESCLASTSLPEREWVARGAALGRRLLQAVRSDGDYPQGDLSTMDGYAVAAGCLDAYRIQGENRPGCGPGNPLESGAARRIFTGATLPDGATHVIPQESTNRRGDVLEIVERPVAGYVRPKGSESLKGALVLQPGVQISPVELSILAMLGIGEVCVAKRPVIGHLVTGDELLDPDTPDAGGMIRDSNTTLVESSLRSAGYSITYLRRVGDDVDALANAIDLASRTCDVLLVSGGASAGDHDHTRSALRSVGYETEIDSVDLRPGKPIGIARRGQRWAIALPGNPLSHLVSLNLFVIPLLRGLEGETRRAHEFLHGVLDEAPSTGVPQRPTFWPVVASLRQGVFHLRACRFLSSGDLIGLAGANALLYLEKGIDPPSVGCVVRFVLLGGHL